MVVTAPSQRIIRGTMMFVKADVAGAPTDAEITTILSVNETVSDGMTVANTVDFKIYVRMGGVWKGTVALT